VSGTEKPGFVFLDGGWYVRNKDGAKIGPFASEADASGFLHCLYRKTENGLLLRERRWHGKIQRATDAAYLSSLDSIMGNGNPHFPPLTEQERETITKHSKHMRQTQRGLRNKPAADKGNLKRGHARFERVKRLEGEHDRKGTLEYTRAAKIARHMNVETPSDPISIDHVRRLRRLLRK